MSLDNLDPRALLAFCRSGDEDLFRQAVMAARDGIVIASVAPGARDTMLCFVNEAFERLTGYRAEEILGRDCRFLQGDDCKQPASAEIRCAIARGRSCVVRLRNYRKDGPMFLNELSLSPIRGADGREWRYVGIQNDVTHLYAT